MYSDWTPPPDEAVELNKVVEPEGERLRAELTEWLKKNKIVSAIIETKEHFITIDIGSCLPDQMKSVLTVHGSIYIRDMESCQHEPAPYEPRIGNTYCVKCAAWLHAGPEV